MLGNVDFTGLEHWAPFNFLRELLWWIFFRLCPWDAQYFISLGYSCRRSGSHHGQNHCSLLKPKSNPKQIPGPKFTPPPPKKIPCQITKPLKFSESIKWYIMKNRDISFEYPKNPYLNQATQNNACQTFPTPKNPEIENFKPKKILPSSILLDIRRTPGWVSITPTKTVS